MIMVSCEDMVTNIDVPQSEPHYVIHSYISPEDSLLTVIVGKSQPVFGQQNNDNSWVDQAHVFVNNFELSRDNNNSCCFWAPASVLDIKPGGNYTVLLQIGTQNICQASCTVPVNRNESIIFKDIDSVQNHTSDENSYYDYYVIYSFTDIAGEENYYKVALEVLLLDQYSGDTVVFYDYYQNEQFIKDALFEGGVYTDRIKLDMAEPVDNIIGFNFILYTCDKNYYNYHRAIFSQTGNNPFSEPVIIPSNVENGLGCVAGLRKYTKRVFIR